MIIVQGAARSRDRQLMVIAWQGMTQFMIECAFHG
jgi:hypothetical protein